MSTSKHKVVGIAYKVISIKDLNRMLREAKKSQARDMAAHKAAGNSPNIACAVFYAPLIDVGSEDGALQLGPFSENEENVRDTYPVEVK